VSPNYFQQEIVKQEIKNPELLLLAHAKRLHEIYLLPAHDEVDREENHKLIVDCQRMIAMLAEKEAWALSGIMEEGLKR